LQTGGLHGLEQVVHGLRLEGLHRVFVVGGDKHQRRKGTVRRVGRWPLVGQLGGGLQPGQPRHADVEKQHVGRQRHRLLHGRQAVAHAGHHLQLGPGPRQFGL
jgi:hypothetical protein